MSVKASILLRRRVIADPAESHLQTLSGSPQKLVKPSVCRPKRCPPLLGVGVVGAWLAVLTGYSAQEYASQTVRESRGLELLQLHSKMAYFVAALWSGLLLGRIYLERPEAERWRTLWLAFAFLGCLLVFFTAYLGGRMVYEFGAGVARPSLSPIDLQGSMPR